MRHLSVCYLLVTLGGFWPAAAKAAPPTLDSLFPPGGQRGQTVEVAVAGTFDKWPVQAWVDASGIEAKASKTKGKLAVTIAPNANLGTCWIRLYDDQGASALRPFVVGTLPEMLEQEPNDEPKQAQVLASPNVTINAKLEKDGDVDVFAFELKKGQTLVASVEANRMLKSPMDGVLQVLSADGFVLAQNDDYHGIDPQTTYTARKDGRHLVRVFAFPSDPTGSIKFSGGPKFVYRLTLTTNGFADYAYPLAVSRAKPEVVEVIGWNLPTSPLKVAIAPNVEGEFASVTHAAFVNPLRVRLEPHPVTVKVKTNSRQHPQPIALPITITGRLDKAGDVDVYQFTAKKGQKVSLALDARTLGFPLDPILQVTDSVGKVLSRIEAKNLNQDVAMEFNPPNDGDYRIEVRDFHGDGGPRYVYRLQAVFAEPDFSLQVPAVRFALTPGKPLDIPVSVLRRNGHKQDIEISAVGLPKGITAQAMFGPVGKDVVQMRLSGEGEAVSGSFRIVGKVKDLANEPRVARAPVPEYGVFSERLWLTFGPKATVAKDPTPKKK